MKNFSRAGMAATLMATACALSGCAPTVGERTETFELTGQRVDIVNSNVNMPVDVSERPDLAGVVVTLKTETIGKSARMPDWSLDGTSLNVGTPCDAGFVGYCEGRFSVVVPAGTEVYLNGSPATLR
ncbi:hypothetical protein O4220_21800 [Rhodococcus ruber]|uniref:Lipoprotein n=1 Tax=Rhodococcus ruber TaxID=1830 RepID=A0ABT4ML94_9NOCA|nr:hypothetical protein [Rhodococcus ruber]MCZ4521155.1 hypothetical protein [Rhodococcus ruber]